MKILDKGSYYGSEKALFTQEGIKLSEYEYTCEKTAWHLHENPYFMYILEGKVVDVSRKNEFRCQEGNLVFHHWQEPHYNWKASSRVRGFHIEPEGSWFSSWDAGQLLWEGSKMVEDPGLHLLTARIYYEFKCADLFSRLSLEALLLQLGQEVETAPLQWGSQIPPWVGRLRELVRDGDTPLSLKDLSSLLHVHPAHLSRAVPKYFKTTLGDYIRSEKIRKAMEAMGDRRKTFTQLAFDCGFSDQSHFNRIFKRFMGISPGEYRALFLS